MYLRVRLYKRHDYDLLWYGAQSYIDLSQVIYMCLCAYVRQIPFSPPELVGAPIAVEPGTEKRHHVTLDDQQDADVIMWLNTFDPQSRNAVIKMVTRSYLPKTVFSAIIYHIANSHIALEAPEKAPKQPRPKKAKAAQPAPMPYIPPAAQWPQNAQTYPQSPVMQQPAMVRPVIQQPVQQPVMPQPVNPPYTPPVSVPAQPLPDIAAPQAAPMVQEVQNETVTDAFDMFEAMMD